MKKTYVDVIVLYNSDGRIIPKCILWDDGRSYDIDKIIDVRRAASLKSGGMGWRYTVTIGEHRRILFFEDVPDIPRWFIEPK